MDRSIIVYSSIVRDYVILVDCESSEYDLTISSTLLTYVKTIQTNQQQSQQLHSCKINDLFYRILSQDGFAFCGVFGVSYNEKAAFDFLTEIRDKFFLNKDLSRHGRLGLSSLVSSSFGDTLKSLTQKWSVLPASSAHSSRLNELRTQVDEVREIMTANVERVLERGERLEDLLEKSEDLESSSSQFRNSAQKVQRKLCCKNFKWTIICTLTVLVVVVVIILFALYEANVFSPSPTTITTTPKPL